MTLPPLPPPHATSFYANPLFSDDQMRAYGAACAAAERERCADLLEKRIDLSGLSSTPNWQKYTADLMTACAAAIRAQGEML